MNISAFIPGRWRNFCRSQLFICLLLGAAVLAVYLQVANFDFITWDDDMYVTENAQVKAGLTRQGIRWAFTSIHAFNWHPLTWLSHMTDVQLYGLKPRGHHLTNLVFHLANTILWFLFFLWTTGAKWPAALVAGLFALHPLHVESVAWVSERKDVLSTFFWVLTLWAYAWYAAAPSLRRYLLVALSFGMGLMAKPMLVTLPLVLLLLDVWPLGRWPAAVAGPGGGKEERPASVWRTVLRYWPLLREKIPLLALTGVSCVITVLGQTKAGALVPFRVQPPLQRLANTLVSYCKYVLKSIWPFPMSFFYPLAPIPWWQTVMAVLGLTAMTALLLYASRKRPYLGVGWLWYLITLLPVIGLVQVGGQALADRYTYVPFIGLFIIAAWGGADLADRWPQFKTALALGAGAVLLACLVTAWWQTGYWKNSDTLFVRGMKLNPNNYMAYHHLGMARSNEGRLPEAIELFRETLARAPAYPPGFNNLAIAYARQGRYDLAAPLFKEAIRLSPNNVSYYRNLALAYSQQGKKAEAEALLEHIKWLSGKR